MADYTATSNTLFNNNATTNTAQNTAQNIAQNTSQNLTQQQTTQLPDWYTQGLYSNFMQGTSGLQNVPNVTYGGQYVAPTNWQQQAASTMFGGLTNFRPQQVTPGNVTQFAGGTGQGGLSTANMDFSGYMNPYTSQVIQTSLGELNRQLAQANQNTAGQATLAGAFGGDRAAIAQAENARNANQIASQMISGLNQQNFAQAQAAANQDINRQLQGGTTQAQLGLAAGQGNQLAGLQGANLQLGASNALASLGNYLQQGQTQGNILSYQDWLRTQTTPYQIAQTQLQAGLQGLPYFAQRATTQGSTGTTNQQQTGTLNQNVGQVQNSTQNVSQSGNYPQSAASQIIGGIGTAAGLAGALTGSTGGGLIGGLTSLYNNTLGSNGLNLFGASDPYGYNTAFNNYVGNNGYNSGVDYTAGLSSPPFDFSTVGGGFNSGIDYTAGLSDLNFARGGLIGFDNGGDLGEGYYTGGYDTDPYYTGGDDGTYLAAGDPAVDNYGEPPPVTNADFPAIAAEAARRRLPVPPIPPRGGIPSAPVTPVSAPAGGLNSVASTPAAGLTPQAQTPIQLPPEAAAADSQNPYLKPDYISRSLTGTNPSNNWWMPVLAAGLGILGQKGPHAGVNIGQGAMAGLQMLQQMGGNRLAMAKTWEEAQNDMARRALLGEQTESARYGNMINRLMLPNTQELINLSGHLGGGGSGVAPTSANATTLIQPALASIPTPQMQDIAINAAKTTGMSPDAFAYWVSGVHNESGWNPDVKNGAAGEIGLGQVKLETARTLIPGITAEQLRDPQTNAMVSAMYFNQKWQQSGGNPRAALIGYNSGTVNSNDPRAEKYADAAIQRIGAPQGVPQAADPALVARQQYLDRMALGAAVNRQYGAAASIIEGQNQRAGPGAFLLNGVSVPVPGYTQNRYNQAAAQAAGAGYGGLGPYAERQNILTQATADRARAEEVARAPFHAPVTINQTSPEGVTTPVTMPFPQYVAGTQTAAAAGAPGQPTDYSQLSGATTGRPLLTPGQAEVSKKAGETINEYRDQATHAQTVLGNVQTLRSAAQYFRPDAFGGNRMAAGRALIGVMQNLGMEPSAELQQMIASGEVMTKIGTFMANEISRQMGSREAAQIVMNNLKALPNTSMTEQGFHMLLANLEQEAKYVIDRQRFMDDVWVPNHRGALDLSGMQEAFEKEHPVEAYSSRVIPIPFTGQESAGSMKKNAFYNAVDANGNRGIYMWNGEGLVKQRAQ